MIVNKFEVEVYSKQANITWFDILHLVISSKQFKKLDLSLCSVKLISKKEE